jgi:hypothetical protein
MNFKTIGMGVALTCGSMAVGSAFSVAPAQAATISGTVNITGNAIFKNGNEYNKNTPAPGESVKFSSAKVQNDSTTGSFTSYIGQAVTIPQIFLTFIPGSTTTGLFGEKIHQYTADVSTFNPLITFSDGLKFEVQNPFKVIKGSFNDASKTVSAGSNLFTGKFINQYDKVVGSGLFTINQQNKNGTFSMTVSAVPEPLTILGSITALGMGAALRKKQAQKQAREKVTA